MATAWLTALTDSYGSPKYLSVRLPPKLKPTKEMGDIFCANATYNGFKSSVAPLWVEPNLFVHFNAASSVIPRQCIESDSVRPSPFLIHGPYYCLQGHVNNDELVRSFWVPIQIKKSWSGVVIRSYMGSAMNCPESSRVNGFKMSIQEESRPAICICGAHSFKITNRIVSNW